MCVGIQFSLALLLNSLSFSIEWAWHLCGKSVDHICEGLFLGSILSVGLNMLMLVARFDYYSFVILKLESVSPPNLFFFKIILTVWGPLKFHMNFSMGFSIFVKNVVRDTCLVDH